VTNPATASNVTPVPGPAAPSGPMPALYLGHGAPPLLDDARWMGQLGGWSGSLARPSAILIVSAHWQTAPMAISATTRVPLVYDFYGFPQHYYEMTYDAPGAPDLGAKVKRLMPANEPVLDRPRRGLDHGAWVPLKAM
jgi:4,5-DOPA dioxygenase extradiol